MSRRRAVVAVIVFAGLLGAFLVLPVLAMKFDESSVPPTSDFPALPDGVSVESSQTPCGSDGCYRELWLVGSAGWSPAEVVKALRLNREKCEARSLFDRRQICTGATVYGEKVQLYLQFDH
ncbi:MAG TPA: hypothetical protein VLL08_27385 [Kineosporiaceae bacterium]|nr:hypothetical protein [Kineosporiaceae bacterium]